MEMSEGVDSGRECEAAGRVWVGLARGGHVSNPAISSERYSASPAWPILTNLGPRNLREKVSVSFSYSFYVLVYEDNNY